MILVDIYFEHIIEDWPVTWQRAPRRAKHKVDDLYCNFPVNEAVDAHRMCLQLNVLHRALMRLLENSS